MAKKEVRKGEILFIFFLLLIVGWGCATSPKISPLDASLFSFKAVEIELAHVDTYSWTVTYRTDSPVRALFFEQQGHRFRTHRWKPLSDAWELSEVDAREGIFRKDQKEFTEVTIKITPEYGDYNGGYEFSLPFTDGSFALYSSEFLLHGQDLKTHFTFHPLKNEKVLIRGQEFSENKTWSSPSTLNVYGDYIYFGKIIPEKWFTMTVLLDPGLPNWIKVFMKTHLLQALGDLNKLISDLGADQLFLIMSRWPNPNDLHRFAGGAGQKWIFLDLQGLDWNKESAEAKLKLYLFATHEFAHLWTSQERPDFERINWMNEGGANIIANLMALRSGQISKKIYYKRVESAAESCQRERESLDLPLNDLQSGRNRNMAYDCGMLVHATLNSILNKKLDFFGFWKRLLKEANSNSTRVYDETLYFNMAQDISNTEVVSQLKRFVTEPSSNQNTSEEIKKFLKKIQEKINL